MSTIAAQGKGLRCLLVQAGQHVCALPLNQVRRVARAVTVHPLPGSAPELLGLAELGGEPLPVLDLARLIGAPPGARPSYPVTVVATVGPPQSTELAGLAADAALTIAEVGVDDLAGGGGLVRGEVIVDGRSVRLIDLEALGGKPDAGG